MTIAEAKTSRPIVISYAAFKYTAMPKKKEAAATFPWRRPPRASVSRLLHSCARTCCLRSGVSSGDGARLWTPVKFDLLSGYLREHGNPILNAETFNLSVPQIGTETNKFTPRGR